MAHIVNMEICHDFLKRYLLQGTYIIYYTLYMYCGLNCLVILLLVLCLLSPQVSSKQYFLTDPAYRKAVPNLDGVEQHSEHILFGAHFGDKGAKSKL